MMKKLFLALIAMSVTFVVADTALRIYARRVVGPEPESVLFEPHPVIGKWHRANASAVVNFRGSPPHRVTFNAFGCRGPNPKTLEKPAGVTRIVCLGESSTEEGCVPDGCTWPERMQAGLDAAVGTGRVEVINLGCAGFSTGASASNLVVNGLRFQPDIVVLYHGNNDLWKALMRRPELKWQETYVDYEARQSSRLERLLCKSIILDRLNRARYYAGGRRNRAFLQRYAQMHESEKAAIPMEGIETEARERLTLVADLCRQNRALLVIGIQATLIGPDLPTSALPRMWELLRWTWNGRQISWSSFDAGLRRIKDMQRGFAAQQGLSCIDVERAVPKDPAYYFDHIHYAEPGSDAVGRAMARGLAPIVQALRAAERPGRGLQ